MTAVENNPIQDFKYVLKETFKHPIKNSAFGSIGFLLGINEKPVLDAYMEKNIKNLFNMLF